MLSKNAAQTCDHLCVARMKCTRISDFLRLFKQASADYAFEGPIVPRPCLGRVWAMPCFQFGGFFPQTLSPTYFSSVSTLVTMALDQGRPVSLRMPSALSAAAIELPPMSRLM